MHREKVANKSLDPIRNYRNTISLYIISLPSFVMYYVESSDYIMANFLPKIYYIYSNDNNYEI